MSNPFVSFFHPETVATPVLPMDLLERVAVMLPDHLGLSTGSTADDRKAAAAVIAHVPEAAMRAALEVDRDHPGFLPDKAAIVACLAERERLAKAADVLRRLAIVEQRLRRHLTVVGEPAAQAVLDLYSSLKRRAARRPDVLVEANVQRLAELLPHAGSEPVKRGKKKEQEKPTG